MQAVLDSVWVLFAAFLVFFMHAGFSLVESGFCRKKNAVMVLLKNVVVVALGSIVYYFVGYGLMFGEDAGGLIGTSMFAPSASAADVGTLPIFVFLFFQLVFAATSSTIVSGAVAERARLGTFMVFTLVAAGIIYPIVGHWVWGGGWLADLGFHDFAGSTVVHAVGGGMALAGAVVVGPRIGKYAKDGSPRPMPAHNFPLAALGVLILWLDWFGFNGGSTLVADPRAIGSVILATNLAAAAGLLAALLHTRMRTGMLDLSMGLNGALAGLVGITAGADVIGPVESLVVGVIGGVLVVEGVFLLEKRGVDDPVGAFAVAGWFCSFGCPWRPRSTACAERIGYPFEADGSDAFWSACEQMYARSLEYMLEQLGVRPRGDLRDLFATGLAERVELELAVLAADVDAVENERMEVGVEPQRAVAALHEGDRADQRVLDRAQPERALGSPSQRARQRADERTEHVGAQPPVVPHRVASKPLPVTMRSALTATCVHAVVGTCLRWPNRRAETSRSPTGARLACSTATAA